MIASPPSKVPFEFTSRATTGIGVEVALSPTSSYPRSHTPTCEIEIPAGNPAAESAAKLTELQPVLPTDTRNSGLAAARRMESLGARNAPGVTRLGNARADS